MKNLFKRFLHRDKKKKSFQWNTMLDNDSVGWNQRIESAKKGPKILIATSVGGYDTVTSIEALLAVALTVRGADVHFLLCDKFLPACLMVTTTSFKDPEEFARSGPQKSICDTCFAKGYELFKTLDLPIYLYSNLVTEKEQQKSYRAIKSADISILETFTFDGLKIGEHAKAGALRYFARASFDGEPHAEKVQKRYLHAAFLTMFAVKRLLETHTFDCVVFNHGIYIPQGIIGELARKKGIRVVNWNPAYRKKSFIFSHNDTYHHTLLSEPVKNWENLKWNARLEKKLLDYLKSRLTHKNDWIWFHENPQVRLEKIAGELRIDFTKPTIGMLTNVMWDAQLHYQANAFPDMLSWIIQTIQYFKKRKDLQLVIRVHPAEIRGTLPSRQLVADEIHKVFPKLPKNVFVIPPDSNISTYSVMYTCNAVLIYGTKTGVELTSVGIPVIVAGEAWVRNKGITSDAVSPSDYFRLLDQLPLKNKLNKKTLKRAQKYAFHFFFRRMIPIKCVEPADGWPPYRLNVQSMDELMPGRDKGLDVICDGILDKKEFIYPAEQYI